MSNKKKETNNKASYRTLQAVRDRHTKFKEAQNVAEYKTYTLKQGDDLKINMPRNGDLDHILEKGWSLKSKQDDIVNNCIPYSAYSQQARNFKQYNIPIDDLIEQVTFSL